MSCAEVLDLTANLTLEAEFDGASGACPTASRSASA